MLSWILFCTGLMASFIAIAHAHIGVDLSVPTNTSTFKCLVNDYHVEYAMVRAYRSVGEVDENAPDSLRSAHRAGISALSAYLFPCIQTSPYSIDNNISCPSAEMQVDQTIDLLAASNIFFKGYTGQNSHKLGPEPLKLSVLWIDIEDESPSKYYDPNPSVNQQFMSDLVGYITSMNISVGIYSTKTYWSNIMANIDGYGQYPLWYPRYDGTDSMDFFEPFADFSECYIKQTGGDVGYCGITQVDSDYSNQAIH